MKAKVIKIYRDKNTNDIHGIGEELEMTKKRFDEINSTAFGIFLEEIMEKTKVPLVTTLSGLAIGELELIPVFDPSVHEYTAITANKKDTITAVASDENATITVLLNDESCKNGKPATWGPGENKITVKCGSEAAGYEEYNVTVTKTE